jgi:predicted ester cyclase
MSTEENKATVHRYFEEYHNQRKDEVLSQILADDLLEGARASTAALRAGFPDVHITINEMLAEEDMVATIWTGQGTHSGEWSSPVGTIATTGRQVTWTATTTLRISSGKISEVIGTNWDHLGILQQIGAVASVSHRSGA